uniref:Uncharacterized protein n=1 Tax=Daphnia galeata TaxID=27404 RepID=A0A8J2WJW3_9CRUS|nr:unnamed protein product [Daphnia galeata]
MKLEKMNNEFNKGKRDFTNKLEATSEILNSTVKNLVKTNNELKDVKRDLTNKLEGTRRELEKTKTELEKMRSGLSKTVNNLSAKINENEKKLTNFSTELKVNIQRVGHEIKVAEGNVKKDLRGKNFKQFGNCNKKFGLDDDGIEQHEIRRCGFDQNVKW